MEIVCAANPTLLCSHFIFTPMLFFFPRYWKKNRKKVFLKNKHIFVFNIGECKSVTFSIHQHSIGWSTYIRLCAHTTCNNDCSEHVVLSSIRSIHLLLCGAFRFGYLLKVVLRAAMLFDAVAVHNNKKIAAKHQRGATDFAEHLRQARFFLSPAQRDGLGFLCSHSENFPCCWNIVAKSRNKEPIMLQLTML